MFALTRSQICYFDNISSDKYVLCLDIAVKDAFAMHELNGPEDLKHVEFDFLESEWVFGIFEAFVEIHIHQLEY